MGLVKAVRNISNRPLSFEFDDASVTIRPRDISEYYPVEKWEGSLAQQQLNKYVADREAKVLQKEGVATTRVQSTPTVEQPTSTATSNTSTKGGE